VFRKPFFVATLRGKASQKSVRMKELLQGCGLSDLFIEEMNAKKIREKLVIPIDWDAVVSQLHIQREASLLYLQEALG
jgi:hypothetical protein